jgi:hypothetical protein
LARIRNYTRGYYLIHKACFALWAARYKLRQSEHCDPPDARNGEWRDGHDLDDAGFALMLEIFKGIGELLLAVILIYGMIVPDPIGTGIKLWRRLRDFYRMPF